MAERPTQYNSGPPAAIVVILWHSWDFDPREAGRRAIRRHREALRRLADD